MYAFYLLKKFYKMVDFFCVILTIVKMLVVRVCLFFVAGLGIAGLGMGRLKFGLGWAKCGLGWPSHCWAWQGWAGRGWARHG